MIQKMILGIRRYVEYYISLLSKSRFEFRLRQLQFQLHQKQTVRQE